ncbi:putative dipeptidyl peptidase IV [Coleophoma crateriformis]|uniref:Putative dipeptidyl peptidase IV n=1 Tax=Coleophoma crateriformis TaxID=565419 RepID=A0A3D8QQA4_9HELO|nr:putative dipeptidyl peptidase IV [Coleophoma crateriformis]
MSASHKTTAAFGSWKSPITTELLTAKSIGLSAVHAHASNGMVYYQEDRPAEAGRSTIVEYSPTQGAREVLPKEYSASSGIHEYGGGEFCVGADGDVVVVDGNSNAVLSINPSSGVVRTVIEPNENLRWADFDVHPTDPKWILAVKEDHVPEPVENLLVAVNSETKETHVVARGADFYKYPRFSLDGKRICWVQWNHPDMPWTGTELYVADWHDGKIGEKQYVDGKAIQVAVDEPSWGRDGTLFYVSDATGYGQLYRLDPGAQSARHIQLKGLEDVEFSGRNPALGSRTFLSLSASTLVAAYTRNATNFMISIDLATETWKDLGLPLIAVRKSALARVSDTRFAVIGGTAKAPVALYEVDLADPSSLKIIKSSMDIALSDAYFSEAQHISFPRVYGNDKTGTSHCLFTPPKNPEFEGLPGTLPPLIVSLHGGPTSHVAPGLALEIQYWTSRGYAWVDINYTGSSGYGRAYRDALNGKWGVADTDDSASCVSHLISAWLVDGSRIGIRGGSAGGYGVLQALCIYPDLWAGGVSEYGVSDVAALARDTHKFESHYLFKLLFENGTAGISEEEIERVYRERSPLYHADQITAPVLLLQGTADKVVPPNQTLAMEKIIKERGGDVDVKVVMFEGEGHGFTKAENVKQAIEEEEKWWTKTLVRS